MKIRGALRYTFHLSTNFDLPRMAAHLRTLDEEGLSQVHEAIDRAAKSSASAKPADSRKHYCFYVYKMQCSPGYFGPQDRARRRKAIRNIPVSSEGEAWEDVRYLIERDMGAHSVPKQRKSSAQYSYADGYLYDPENGTALQSRQPLRSGDVVKPNDKIIVWRRPSATRPWVPPKFAKAKAEARAAVNQYAVARARNETPESAKPAPTTEEEKMQTIMEQSASAFGVRADDPAARDKHAKKAAYAHQRGHAGDTVTRRPPPDYVCHRCEKKGHWKADCPTRDDPMFRPRDQITFAHGVPRRLMRDVQSEEDMQHALRDPKNPSRFVVVDEQTRRDDRGGVDMRKFASGR